MPLRHFNELVDRALAQGLCVGLRVGPALGEKGKEHRLPEALELTRRDSPGGVISSEPATWETLDQAAERLLEVL